MKMRAEPSEQNKYVGRRMLLWIAAGLVIGGGVGLLAGNAGWGVAIGILLGATAGALLNQSALPMRYPPGQFRRIVISLAVFCLAFPAAVSLLERGVAGPLRFLVALLPCAIGACAIFWIASAIAQLDELQRRIQLEAIAIGFAGAALAAFTYGMLGLVGVQQASWLLVPMVMVAAWLVGKLWTLRKYR